MTVQWLPERLQRGYGLKTSGVRLGLYHLIAGSTVLVYLYLLRRLKTLPSRLYIKDIKKAVKRIKETGS